MLRQIIALSIRVSTLAALYFITAPVPQASAAGPEYWGHCVMMSEGGCICKAGPSPGGQYHCHSSGTSCAQLFPDNCSA